jgi:hypothetical protein
VLLHVSQNNVITHIYLALYGALGLKEICIIALQYALNEVIDIVMNNDRFMKADVYITLPDQMGVTNEHVLTMDYAFLVWASLNHLNITLKFLRIPWILQRGVTTAGKNHLRASSNGFSGHQKPLVDRHNG